MFGYSRETEGFCRWRRCFPRTANRKAVRKCPQKRKSFSLSSVMNNISVIRCLTSDWCFFLHKNPNRPFVHMKYASDDYFNHLRHACSTPADHLMAVQSRTCKHSWPTHTHTHISTHSQVLHQIPERSQLCAAQVPPMSNLMAVYFALSASRLLRHRTASERQQREWGARTEG